MFIWTVQDIVNGLVLLLIALFFAGLGSLILVEKIQRKFKAWRKPAEIWTVDRDGRVRKPDRKIVLRATKPR